MEIQHTKGEWKLLDDCNIESTKGKSIASVYWNTDLSHTTMIETEEEGKANAKLIVVSPELLEALKGICEDLEDEQQAGRQAFKYHYELAIKAIEKATS